MRRNSATIEIVELGRGSDNTAFAVGELVLRVAEEGDAGREARRLEVPVAPERPFAPRSPTRVTPTAWLSELEGPPALLRVLHESRPRPSPQRVVRRRDHLPRARLRAPLSRLRTSISRRAAERLRRSRGRGAADHVLRPLRRARGPRLRPSDRARRIRRERRAQLRVAFPEARLQASPGRVAQWESARLTRERSLVRTQPRP